MKLIQCLIICFIILSGCKKDGQQADSLLEQTYNEVDYGIDPAQKMDIYLPAGRTSETKLLLFIPGDTWSDAEKGAYTAIFSDMEGQGFAIAIMNYRHADAASGILFSALASDVRLALDFLKTKAAGFVFSENKIIIAGHSAGGHLALYTAYNNNADNVIKAVISLAGPTDLTNDYFINDFDLNASIENLTGTSFITDPTTWTNASPITFVNTASPPTLLQYCFFDVIVPPLQGELLDAELTAQSVDHQYILYSAYEHDMGSIFNAGLFPDDVKQDIYDFIETHAN